MNLGTLNVLLKASGAAQFHGALSKAIDQVDKVSKAVKRASREMGQAGLGLAAVAAGAIALAASVDKGIAAELRNLKMAFVDLAVPIAQLLVPAMRDFAEGVRAVADFVAGLSPRTREMIVQFIQVAAVVGATALVVSKVAGAIEALAGVLALVTAGPVILVGLALGAVLALVLVLHKAWRENWGGMRDYVHGVVSTISGYWQTFSSWFQTELLDKLITGWAAVEKVIAKAGIAAKIATGQMDLDQWGAAVRRSDAAIDRWADSMKGGGLAAAALDLGAKVKDGFLDAVGALKQELKIVAKELGLDKLFSGSAGKAARHGGVASDRSDVSGMGAISALSMQAAQQKIDTAASVLADNIATNSAFLDRGLKFAAAQRLAAEQSFTGRIKSALSQVGSAVASQAGTIFGKLKTEANDFGSVLQGAAQGFSSGGPIGAIIGAIVAIFVQLKAFGKIVESIGSFFGRALANIDKAIGPFIEAFVNGAEVTGDLIEMVTRATYGFEIIGFVLEVIGKVISLVSMSMMGAALGIIRAVQGIMDFFKANTAGIKKTGDDIEAKLKASEKALGVWSWDKTATKLDDGMHKAADAAERVSDAFNELLHNIPTSYKGLPGARFAAENATGSTWSDGSAAEYSPGGGLVTTDGETGGVHPTDVSPAQPVTIAGGTFVIQANNMFELYRELQKTAQLQTARSSRNSTLP